jgi:hypothetical protein
MKFEHGDEQPSRINDMFQCLFKKNCLGDRLRFVRPSFGEKMENALDILKSSSFVVPYKIDLDEMIEVMNSGLPGVVEAIDSNEIQNMVTMWGDVKLVDSGVVGEINYIVRDLPLPLDINLGFIKGSFLTTVDGTSQSIFDIEINVVEGRVALTVDIPAKENIPRVVTTLLEREHFSEQYFFSGLKFGKDRDSAIRTFSEVRLFAWMPHHVLSKLKLVDNVGVSSSDYSNHDRYHLL